MAYFCVTIYKTDWLITDYNARINPFMCFNDPANCGWDSRT